MGKKEMPRRKGRNKLDAIKLWWRGRLQVDRSIFQERQISTLALCARRTSCPAQLNTVLAKLVFTFAMTREADVVFEVDLVL